VRGAAPVLRSIGNTVSDIADTSDLVGKGKAIAKVAGQDAISRIPVAGRVVRRPSIGDYWNAAKTKAPQPVFPGAPDPIATPEQLNPSLVSEARTLPGQISPERIVPEEPAILRAQPIPARTGLALPPGPPSAILEPALDATGENKPFAGGMDEAPEAAAPQAAAPSAPPTILSPIESTPTPNTTPAAIEQQLNDALGGKPAEPLIKGVSLRNQAAMQKARTLADLSGSATDAPPTAGPTDLQSLLQKSLDQVNAKEAAANPPAAPASKPGTVGDLPTAIKKSLQQAEPLPEGFTPVESSVLKGFKYSPEAREFESITNDGAHYIHGDVAPEEAQTFADAGSKGKAWSKLKSQSPLVAKVLDGKRVAMTKSAPAGGEDFSSLLGESLKQAQARKLAELQ
jgi:hypothetical protein